MSRHSSAPRTLTLTEELEKLEQSITLTLQEIDSNFSRAHRIVTSSILPIVEEYAKHSGDVWEGSKFWKQFFEASANVSLAGYEEATPDEEDLTHTDTTTTLLSPTDHDDSTASGADGHPDQDGNEEDDFSIDSPTQQRLPPSTTKRSAGKAPASNLFRSPSPRKYTGKNPVALSSPADEPSTPRPAQSTQYPQSSPFEPESAFQPSTRLQTNNDPLLHRILDKNYRIQATPHTQRKKHQPQPSAAATAKQTPATATRAQNVWSSPQSSPDISAPQLRSDLFSPTKATAPRTPGISILTPAARKVAGRPQPTTSTGRQLFSPQDRTYTSTQELTKNRASRIFEDSSDEDDDGLGMSPPKTMQFHVPQSRLLQTPAREASRRIVEDLLLTAGADGTEEIEGEEEESPSLVRKVFDVDEDTF